MEVTFQSHLLDSNIYQTKYRSWWLAILDQNTLHSHCLSNYFKSVASILHTLCYRFFVGSLSGLIGAGSVYPIDLIKTRMMNQRNSKEMISRAHAYHDTMDCVMKTLRCSISLGHRAKIPSDSIPFSNLKASGIGSMKNIPQSGSCTKSQILCIKC